MFKFSEFLRSLKNVKTQESLVLSLFVAAALYLSPTTNSQLWSNGVNLMIALYWLILFLYIWSLWFQKSLRGLFYFLSLLFSFIISLMTTRWYLFVILLFLGLWNRRRNIRIKNLSWMLGLSTALSTAQTLSTNSPTATPVAPQSATPNREFLTGYKVRNIISCSAIDKIPWQLRTDGRKIRLLVKDELTFSNDKKANLWELYQIINRKDFITYVFKRIRKNNTGSDIGHEYIAVRGSKMERIIQSDKKSKSSIVPVESHNLKQLINRTAFTFYHQDGSTIEYIPGPTERSTVIIKPMHQGGYTLSPIYLNGIGCDRPESLTEDDLKGDTLGTKRSKQGANPAAK